MNQSVLTYHEEFQFVPQAVAQIPWGHNMAILENEFLPFGCG